MADGGIPSAGPEISIPALRGLNLRKSRSQLDSGECDRNFGLYPSATGVLSRIPGKVPWIVFEDANGDPLPVLQEHQLFDGTGNIIFQVSDTRRVYTLDELRNRVTPYSLTPTPSTPSTSYALILHAESNGAGGSALGAADNTFYPTTITALASDANGIVAALTANSFSLPLGTYQIDAFISYGMATDNVQTEARAGLYSLTSGAFKTNIGSSSEIIGTSGNMGQIINNVNINQSVYIMGRFQVTAALEAFAIYMAVDSSGSNNFSNQTKAQGSPAALITTKSEVYSQIQITKE